MGVTDKPPPASPGPAANVERAASPKLESHPTDVGRAAAPPTAPPPARPTPRKERAPKPARDDVAQKLAPVAPRISEAAEHLPSAPPSLHKNAHGDEQRASLKTRSDLPATSDSPTTDPLAPSPGSAEGADRSERRTSDEYKQVSLFD